MHYKNKIIIVLAFYFSITSYSQSNGRAYYKKVSTFSFSNDEVNSDSKLKSSLNSVNGKIDNFEYVLEFNDSLATYREIKNLKIDEDSRTAKISRVFSGYKGPYFYDIKSNTSTRIKGRYLIEKDFGDYDWDLSKEKLIINNLTCYKATTTIELEGRRGLIKRPVTAWYTPNINMSIGPDGFTGLPGLIIQIETNKVVTTLKTIEFKQKNLNIMLPTKGKKLTEKEFKTMMRDMVENRDR